MIEVKVGKGHFGATTVLNDKQTTAWIETVGRFELDVEDVEDIEILYDTCNINCTNCVYVRFNHEGYIMCGQGDYFNSYDKAYLTSIAGLDPVNVCYGIDLGSPPCTDFKIANLSTCPTKGPQLF